MYCANTIRVRTERERMFALAADVERWPSLLPHYRWVRVLRRAGDWAYLDMAARRGAIPVRWQAIQTVYPAAGLITYRHVGGITRGMRVVWQMVQDGTQVEVTIRHALAPHWPMVGGWPSQVVVGDFFVEYIAGQTLRHLRAYAESGNDELDALAHRREPSQTNDDCGDDE
jgi:ribosome-associated toxin RatA of RatAB toxin-antitoxin module